MLRFLAAGPKQNIVLNNFLSLTAAGLKKYSKIGETWSLTK